jgi:hypothetical protein
MESRNFLNNCQNEMSDNLRYEQEITEIAKDQALILNVLSTESSNIMAELNHSLPASS